MAYGGPESRETVTMNMPHYMFFVPNLGKKYVGAGTVMGRYPYLIKQRTRFEAGALKT